jgi:hypothetical protein
MTLGERGDLIMGMFLKGLARGLEAVRQLHFILWRQELSPSRLRCPTSALAGSGIGLKTTAGRNGHTSSSTTSSFDFTSSHQCRIGLHWLRIIPCEQAAASRTSHPLHLMSSLHQLTIDPFVPHLIVIDKTRGRPPSKKHGSLGGVKGIYHQP